MMSAFSALYWMRPSRRSASKTLSVASRSVNPADSDRRASWASKTRTESFIKVHLASSLED